ncbi:MAG: rhamnogalacturonan acetylesterase, partial [Bacteroidetes bacterium]|nr:rhamnogalacturonan acetylesterase [Bacteroidota bacterium]
MKKLYLLIPIAILSWAFIMPRNTVPQLVVIGDSTASPYAASDYPRMGWAQVLQNYINKDSVIVVDKARSGRSSKSYYHEPEGWPAVQQILQPGDFLFIQFGHNDAKMDDTTRFTDPFTTYKAYLKNYIDQARLMGVTPVLMTSIHRNEWETDTMNIKDTHGNYLVATRQLAAEENVALIDMANLTDSLFEAWGYKATTEQIFLNLPPNLHYSYLSGNVDNTHLQETGAYELSKLVADELKAANDSSLASLKPAMYDMIKVPFAIEPPLGGAVQGARYFPINKEK